MKMKMMSKEFSKANIRAALSGNVELVKSKKKLINV